MVKSSSAQESIAGEILKDFNRLVPNRSAFENEWEESAKIFLPSMSGQFTAGNEQTPGNRRTQHMIDSTGAQGLDRFAAIMDSLLTPRNQTYHLLESSNDELNKQRDVKVYYEMVNRILFKERYAPLANFASQNQQNFLSLGAFGTGCVFVDDLWTPRGPAGLRYKNIHLGEIYFSENHQGLIDCAYRRYKLTAIQAEKEFGNEALPEKIQKALKSGEHDKEFVFLHAVKPRMDVDYDRKDYKGMDYASFHVAVEEKKLLREKGFSTFPYAISRYTQASGEIYGRGPAMMAGPAQRTLNEQKKVILKAGHRTVDPVMFMHDDGVLDGVSLRPGAMNIGGVSAEGRPLIHTLPVGRVDIGKDLMDDERASINDAFLVRLFQIMTENPQMTATEVMERTREKGILLAPTVGRQQSEYIGPKIERELDLLSRQGKLPPMPGVLREAEGEYSIRHDSPISRAMRAEEASGIMRTVDYAANVYNITQDPTVMDYFEWDEIIPAMADIHGVPSKWMKDPRKIIEAREQRAQQAEAQELIQAAPGAAAIVKANAVANKAQA